METKLIMEIGCNHQGDIKIAKQMIDDAKELGFWAVKFQKRSPELFPESFKTMFKDPDKAFGKNYYEHRVALEFDKEQMKKLRIYAENKNLIATVSVFDVQAVKEMVETGFKYLKLPSQLYSNWEMSRALIQAFTEYNCFIAHSTGMHNLSEIMDWKYFDHFNLIFYCRSIYPCTVEEIGFGKMIVLRNAIKDSTLGYSSHDQDGMGIWQAVLLGAEYVERHYTLDKTWRGSDHSTVSSDKEEIKRIIDEIEYAETLLNSNVGNEKENVMKKIYRNFY